MSGVKQFARDNQADLIAERAGMLEPTPVRFLAWTAGGFPLAGLILLALACGLVIAGVPLLIQRWRLRARVRALERRVAELEATRSSGPAPGREPPRDPRSHGLPGG